MLNLNNLVNSLSHHSFINNSCTSLNVDAMDMESTLSASVLPQENCTRLTSLPIECLMHIGSFLVDPKTLLNFNIVIMSMKEASIKEEEESRRFPPICTNEEKLFLKLAGQLIKINKDFTRECNEVRYTYYLLCKQLGKRSPYALEDSEGIAQFFELKNTAHVYRAGSSFPSDKESSLAAIKDKYQQRLYTIYCSVWEMLIQTDRKSDSFTYTLIKFLIKLTGFIAQTEEINISEKKIDSQDFRNLENIFTEYNRKEKAEYKEASYLILQLIIYNFSNKKSEEITKLSGEITRLFKFSSEEAVKLIQAAKRICGFFPTPLAIALTLRQEGFVQKIFNLGVDFNERNGEDGRPTWHIAATNRSTLEDLYLLLEKNSSLPKSERFNIDEQNTEGETALHLSAQANALDKVRALLEHGANPDVIIQSGKTTLHLLISTTFINSRSWKRPLKSETREIIRLLMEKSPLDPTVKDQNGNNIKKMANWILQQEITS
jgi:ankyrin repeat protein